MSGGVDSAVAAARARDAGHEVVGVHLALSRQPATAREGARGCCTLDDARDARRAADVLEIPFYVWDLAERFADDVIADFAESYARGETPNPCLRCNERIKFSAVLQRALALDFDAVVTGHHARLDADARGSGAPAQRGSRARTSRTCSARCVPSSWRTRSSRWASRRRPRCAPRLLSAGWPWPTSRTAPTSASCPPVTPPAGSGSGSARAGIDRRRARPAPWSAATTGLTRSRSASAGASR